MLAGDGVWSFAFTPDGRKLLTNGETGAGLVDLATGAGAVVGGGLRSGLNPAALLCPDGRSIVSAEWRNPSGQVDQLSAWRAADPAVPAWRRPVARAARPLAFPDTDTVVTTEFDGAGAVFVSRRVADGEVIGTVPRPNVLGTNWAVSPDRRFLSFCHGPEVHVHRLADLDAGPAVVRGPGGAPVAGVAFHPPGDFLAAAHGPAVTVFDARTWRAARTFDWKTGALRAVAFSPDGSVCAAAGDRGKVVVWDFDA